MATKYQLETIPVWKALEANTECPLCFLQQESERRNVEFFLGNSVMVPEMRVQVNAHGFCTRHWHRLLSGTGRLGLSLAVSTHMASLGERIGKAGRAATGPARKKVISGSEALAQVIEENASDCLMCDRIAHNVSNYLFTLVKLFATEEKFREAFNTSRGLCLYHVPGALRMGSEVLRGDEISEWNQTLLSLVEREFSRLETELEQFSWQFDATSDLKTPSSAQDSVQRAVQKLAGFGSE